MFKTDAGALAAALQAVLPACERRVCIPILGTVRLSVAAGTLDVSASNLDMQIDARATVEGDGPGSLCVSPRPLLALLRQLGRRETVRLERDDAMRAVVTWNGGRVAFPTLPASDFPEMEFAAGRVAAEPDGTALDALKRAYPFMGAQETRYTLMGVCLDGRKGGVNVVATDGRTLFATPVPSLEAFAGRCCIVPRDAIRPWIALAEAGPVTLRLQDNGLKLEIGSGDVRLTTKLIDGDFPQWRNVVSDLADYCRVPLPRPAFMRALGLVLGSFPRAEPSAVLALTDGRLALEAHDPDFGDIAIDLGPAHGPAFEAGFNQRLLRQCASATRGELSVWVPNRGGATVEPVVLSGSESPEGELVVLMPTRSFSRAKLSAPALAEAA